MSGSIRQKLLAGGLEQIFHTKRNVDLIVLKVIHYISWTLLVSGKYLEYAMRAKVLG